MHDYKTALEKTGEVGYVTELHPGLIHASGLPGVQLRELILFENGATGMVYTIDEQEVEVVLLNQKEVRIGEMLTRAGAITIPVYKENLGSVVNSLGERVSAEKATPAAYLPIFHEPAGIATRLAITEPLETGVGIIDITIPLGRGQRELVVGDRKTGKTQFLMQVLLTQARAGTYCVYCAIGKRETEIIEMTEKIKKSGIYNNVCLVASKSEDSAGSIVLTPFTAITIAEYLSSLGHEVLLILDDLTIHAQSCREVALLARRFPGRSAYPGDIFHTHAQILERAGNFVHGNGGHASISCLAACESQLGDITGFITTNLMSMTDGHIYFDTSIFDEGRRPAINPFLSVTRVGHQAQSALARDISREVTSFLIEHRRAREFSHFGSEATDEVKAALLRGTLIYAIFDQEIDVTVPPNIVYVLLANVWSGNLRLETAENLKTRVKSMVQKYSQDANYANQINTLISGSTTFKDLMAKVAQNNLL